MRSQDDARPAGLVCPVHDIWERCGYCVSCLFSRENTGHSLGFFAGGRESPENVKDREFRDGRQEGSHSSGVDRVPSRF